MHVVVYRAFDGNDHYHTIQVCWLSKSHPSFLMTFMSLRSTLVAVAGSMTFNTASTESGASWLEYWDTTWSVGTCMLHVYVDISCACTHWQWNVHVLMNCTAQWTQVCTHSDYWKVLETSKECSKPPVTNAQGETSRSFYSFPCLFQNLLELQLQLSCILLSLTYTQQIESSRLTATMYKRASPWPGLASRKIKSRSKDLRKKEKSLRPSSIKETK